MAFAPRVAVVLGAAGAEAAHPLRGLRLELLLGLGDGVVVDVVVVDVLRCLLGHEALGAQEGAAGQGGGGGGGGQPAPWRQEGVRVLLLLLVLVVVVAVRGAGAGAVAANARGLAAGGLEDPGQVVVQDRLRVLLVAAGGQEGEGVLGGRRVPRARR